MNAITNVSSAPILGTALVFLLLYAGGIIYLFTRKTNGCRRRWSPLDFVWVPMGGLTGVLMLALWWQNR